MTQWGRGRNPTTRQLAQQALPYYCQHCGTTDRLELDHITPLAEGGDDDWPNLQWLCHSCHRVKTEAEKRRGIQRANALRYHPREHHPGVA